MNTLGGCAIRVIAGVLLICTGSVLLSSMAQSLIKAGPVGWLILLVLSVIVGILVWILTANIK